MSRVRLGPPSLGIDFRSGIHRIRDPGSDPAIARSAPHPVNQGRAQAGVDYRTVASRCRPRAVVTTSAMVSKSQRDTLATIGGLVEELLFAGRVHPLEPRREAG